MDPMLDFEEIAEDDLYNRESRDQLVEDDALDAREAAFMQGYDESL